MKKCLLFVLLFYSQEIFAQAVNQIALMSPANRHYLSISMKEVADAYKSYSRIKKANEYYRAALKIYPIGDEAHQLANQMNTPLDDEYTYSNFVMMGDEAYQQKFYKKSLAQYMMALELSEPSALYQKIFDVYCSMGDTVNADYYQQLAQGTVGSIPVGAVEDADTTPTEETVGSTPVDTVEEIDMTMEETTPTDIVADADISELSTQDEINTEFINVIIDENYRNQRN